MSLKFVNKEFERDIYLNVVDATFPKLNIVHKKLLHKYLCDTLQFIASCYDFINDDKRYYIKLQQNDYMDPRWLLTFLLPYIDPLVQPMAELVDLNDLYTLRYDKVSEATKQEALTKKINDICLTAPKYVFTNTQYGRFTYDANLDTYNTISFDESHLRDNYFLLL